LFLQTSNTGDQTNTRDDAGLPIVYGSCKLLDMLGYGSLISSTNTGKAAITQKYLGVDNLSDSDNPLVYSSSQIVNALPFLAYQKIYYDFYSNSQWEKHLAYSYNVDYWSGTSVRRLKKQTYKALRNIRDRSKRGYVRSRTSSTSHVVRHLSKRLWKSTRNQT
jgi:hypothetical protein